MCKSLALLRCEYCRPVNPLCVLLISPSDESSEKMSADQWVPFCAACMFVNSALLCVAFSPQTTAAETWIPFSSSTARWILSDISLSLRTSALISRCIFLITAPDEAHRCSRFSLSAQFFSVESICHILRVSSLNSA